MFDAVVLAGTGKQDDLTASEEVSNKAFIDLCGRPLLSYVLEAICTSPSANRVAVVGPPKALEELKSKNSFDFKVVAERGSMLDNVATGLETVRQDSLCLVVTGDIPLITQNTIEHFVKLCAPHDHDLYYPVLTKKIAIEQYPETQRTYVRLKEGHLTGGNLALVSPAWFFKHQERLEMFISYRKQPLKLLRLFPPALIGKFLMHKLSVVDAEKFLSGLLQMQAKAVFCDDAAIGVDVDKPSDLALMRSILAKNKRTGEN